MTIKENFKTWKYLDLFYLCIFVVLNASDLVPYVIPGKIDSKVLDAYNTK